MAAISIYGKNFVTKLLGRNGRVSYRFISTSDKKKEATEACPSPETIYKNVPDFTKPLESKNWVSYGASTENIEDDRFYTSVFYFSSITLVGCGLAFIWAYYPDVNRKDWARREAFIRLYEREELGLDPVDKNYVDPSKIVLPPDRKLSDDEIII